MLKSILCSIRIYSDMDFRAIQNRKIRIIKKYFRLKIDIRCFLGPNFTYKTNLESKNNIYQSFSRICCFF